jgi:hypothetical protein
VFCFYQDFQYLKNRETIFSFLENRRYTYKKKEKTAYDINLFVVFIVYFFSPRVPYKGRYPNKTIAVLSKESSIKANKPPNR